MKSQITTYRLWRVYSPTRSTRLSSDHRRIRAQERGSHRIERGPASRRRPIHANRTASGCSAWPQVSAKRQRRFLGAGAVEAEPADPHEVGHRGARRVATAGRGAGPTCRGSWSARARAEAMRMIGKLVSCAASALWVHAAVQ